jgi:hypothetical protein
MTKKAAARVQKDPGGNGGTREDTTYVGLRDREAPSLSPGPPTTQLDSLAVATLS